MKPTTSCIRRDPPGAPRGWRAWLIGSCLGLGMSVQAVAEPEVTQTIGAPYAPAGYTLQLTEDCDIVSSGGAPGAYLRCNPGLGWQLRDAAGDLIYPKTGYLPRNAEWAFAGDRVVAFSAFGRVTLVALPSGAAQDTSFSELTALQLEGVDIAALLWSPLKGDSPPMAAPLRIDGNVGPPIADEDLASMDLRSEPRCREAMALVALKVEQLPNRKWTKIVREPSRAPSSAWTCESLSGVRYAGRAADGRWWPLDAKSFKPLTTVGFDHSDKALKAGR